MPLAGPRCPLCKAHVGAVLGGLVQMFRGARLEDPESFAVGCGVCDVLARRYPSCAPYLSTHNAVRPAHGPETAFLCACCYECVIAIYARPEASTQHASHADLVLDERLRVTHEYLRVVTAGRVNAVRLALELPSPATSRRFVVARVAAVLGADGSCAEDVFRERCEIVREIVPRDHVAAPLVEALLAGGPLAPWRPRGRPVSVVGEAALHPDNIYAASVANARVRSVAPGIRVSFTYYVKRGEIRSAWTLMK